MTDVTQHAATPSTLRPLQPALHDLAVMVAAPATVLAGPDGDLGRGVEGWFVADVRRLAQLRLSVEGSDLELVRTDAAGPSRHVFGYVARGLGDPIADPTVLVDRVRELSAEQLVETITVTSRAQRETEVVLHLDLQHDETPMAVVKTGAATPTTPVERRSWRLRLGRGESRSVQVRLEAPPRSGFASGAGGALGLDVRADDPTLTRTVRQSLADLRALLLRDGPDVDADRFLAAGSPWFLTLFGRDALWAARMLAPVDTGLLLSTLRVLARRQGTREDPGTEEQPGKILHEVRDPGLVHSLPPVYYGSVDATPLFVCALADAHDWGGDREQVAALLPTMRRCLEWQLAASAETGWLRYVDTTGRGLSNQGWKDSDDSVQYADGTLARAPIALCEVQAYAYEAAVRGAALLTAHGQPDVPGLAPWAADLRRRFAEDFWVDGVEGGVAIALDRDGRPVDSVTSNMGHVLGTGILDAERAAAVAATITGPDMASGFGVRTLTARSPRFSPLSYHGGSVWPHDTAIAVRGLAAEGFVDEAARLARDLLRAAPGFDHRLPELFGGDVEHGPMPSAYPAACRPQAWAAAAPIAALIAATGLRVCDGRPVVPEVVTAAVGAFTLTGLRVGQERFDVSVSGDGRVILTSR